jgi:4'-phosphopantetheinyl transferase
VIDLAADAIHVWVALTHTYPSAGRGLDAASTLSVDEQTRADRYLRPADRSLFVQSHVAVRQTLARYATIAPPDWTFATNEHGRPEVTNSDAPVGLRFNLSHTAGAIAIVVHGPFDAGVDVEGIGRVENLAAMSRVSFSAAEREQLLALPLETRQLQFARTWALKEAFIKAKGMGLALSLQAFSVDPTDPAAIGFNCDRDIDDDPDAWSFTLQQPTGQHVLATACRLSTGRAPVIEQFTLELD